MILQALNRYYDILLNDRESKVASYGYSEVGVSFALNISSDGELLDVLPLYVSTQRAKKMVETPRPMLLPRQVKRSVNIAPNFLWDNCVYVLGISSRDEDKPTYSRKRFEAFRQHHIDVMKGVDCDAVRALLAFMEHYDPAGGRTHPAIMGQLESILKGGNLVFMHDGAYLHENPILRRAWEQYIAGERTDSMQCLVTGEESPIARLHPSIKRVRGAQSSGASLVSFNNRAFESYGHTREQGLNAPISKKAAFAYTTVLNYLLSDANPNRKFYMGDTTVVYWAESENRNYETAFASIFDPEYTADDDRNGKVESALKDVAEKIRKVQLIDRDALLAELEDENPRFFVLGLAPNASRVSVRFFITDLFGNIVDNIMQHYRDQSIVKEFDNQPTFLNTRWVINETVSKKARNKEAAPLLTGAVIRAILTNSPYPSALYYAIINRIRVDSDDSDKHIRKINYTRAATIKAFLIRKYRSQPDHPIKEVLTMSLNEESIMPPYVLGRLFAVLEKVQQEAIGSMNASIKDRYFTSACATPGNVFPVLLRLSQHHVSKAEYGYASDRRIEALLDKLDLERDPFPNHLTIDEQGVFILGYYHQRADFYKRTTAEAKPITSDKN